MMNIISELRANHNYLWLRNNLKTRFFVFQLQSCLSVFLLFKYCALH